MRLIDADEEAKWASEHILDAKDRYGILDFLRDCSTVDAIPVVRCKDCKYGDYDSKPDGAMVCLRTKDGFWRKETDFCSYGERKDNDEH